jgi:putative membrane protein
MVRMMLSNGGPGWVSWLLMSVGMVAFWFLVLIAIRALLPGVGEDWADRGRMRPQDAPCVLDERLARGELDVREDRARSEALRGPVPIVRPAQAP